MCCFQTFQTPIQFDIGLGSGGADLADSGSMDSLKQVDSDGSPIDDYGTSIGGEFFIIF
jgi:hypothetical protein